jgi:hypothetical protein
MIRGTQQYQSFTIELSAAQVRSLFATPVMLLNSPGEDHYTQIIRMDAYLVPGGVAHVTTDVLEVTYGLAGVTALEFPAALVAGAQELNMAVPPEAPAAVTDYINMPIYLQAAAAVTGSGTGRVIITGAFCVFKVEALAPVNLWDYSILDYSVLDYSITDQGV